MMESEHRIERAPASLPLPRSKHAGKCPISIGIAVQDMAGTAMPANFDESPIENGHQRSHAFLAR
jgi:hypothetical protein